MGLGVLGCWGGILLEGGEDRWMDRWIDISVHVCIAGCWVWSDLGFSVGWCIYLLTWVTYLVKLGYIG